MTREVTDMANAWERVFEDARRADFWATCAYGYRQMSHADRVWDAAWDAATAADWYADEVQHG